MERNIIFVFILLATLSIVNAAFGPCSPIPPATAAPPALKVTSDPDPLVPGDFVTYTIVDNTGAAPKAGKLAIMFADQTGKEVGTENPPVGGTAKVKTPADLPKNYRNAVVLTDETGVTGCAVSDGIAAAPKAKDAGPPKAKDAGPPKAKDAAPKADAPKADAPKADAPKADAPKADAPKADAPKADDPKGPKGP